MCLNIWDEISNLWEQINHLENHGTLPAKTMVTKEERKDIHALDKAKLLELRANSLRPGVSRYKRLMESAKTAQRRLHYEVLMNQYQLQLTEVDKRINEL